MGDLARDRSAGRRADHVDPRRAGVPAGADGGVLPLVQQRRLPAEPGSAAGGALGATRQGRSMLRPCRVAPSAHNNPLSSSALFLVIPGTDASSSTLAAR